MGAEVNNERCKISINYIVRNSAHWQTEKKNTPNYYYNNYFK